MFTFAFYNTGLEGSFLFHNRISANKILQFYHKSQYDLQITMIIYNKVDTADNILKWI
jgi:hypothetical protein